ncbi:hypothetical protein HJFPF1_09013 [Paramyrothecium foliicola]|nr:hypothetical protein HJFPF1_09013 [Paramyrothecium foliicola]
MAISANNQALTAAFVFGLLLNAASGAAFLFIKANGRFLFRDGPRLVLAAFLISSSIWAQVSFAAYLIENADLVPCQVAVAFSSGFDQLARVALEQFLLLAIHNHRKRSFLSIFLQIVVFLRFVVGCGFVGVQRPQFKPVCTSTTLLLPLGIVALAVDFFLAILLFGRAISVGLRKEMKSDSSDASRAKGILLIIIGLLIWTATSIPLLLGLNFIDLIPRTVVPATGLLFVIGIVAVFQHNLVGSNEEIPGPSRSGTPGSDFDASQGPTTRDLQSRNLTTANAYYPPNRYEELKSEAMATTTALPSLSRTGPLPIIKPPAPGQGQEGVGGIPVQGQLYPPSRDEARSISKSTPEDRSRLVRNLKSRTGKIAISNPILDQSSNQNPLNRVATVDLATAARNEKERRDQLPNPLSANLIPSRPAPQVPSTVPRPAGSVTRKVVDRASSSHLPRKPSGELIPELPSKLQSSGTSSSAELSPGAEELRRRSPRQSPREPQQKSPAGTPKTPKAPLVIKTDDPKAAERTSEGLSDLSNPSQSRPFPPPRSPLRPAPAFMFANGGAASSLASPKPESPVPFLVPMPEPLRINRQWEQGADQTQDRATQRQEDVRKTILARTNSAKANVRPSRQKPPSPPQSSQNSASSNSAASAKTFGEPRAIMGLPSNPKGGRAIPRSKAVAQEQTVMLFNEIEYANPAVVKSISEEAAAAAATAAVNLPVQLPAQVQPALVLDRPRPRTRQASMDRPIFPAEVSPRKSQYHMRSLSGGSAKSKLSILNASAGDPSQLPPLPPLPSSEEDPLRPQPNKTKSMTFNEKMDIFYPPTSNTELDIPPLPSPPPVAHPLASVKSQRSPLKMNHNISKFSVDSSVLPNGGRGTWLTRASEFIRPDEQKRQSSPVLPPENLPSPSLWSEGNTRDDTTTAWGSVHSPAQPVSIQKAKEVAVPPMPQLPAIEDYLPTTKAEVAQSSQQEEDSSEVVMVLLDSSIDHQAEFEEPEADTVTEAPSSTWHRRVGDECPTFTRRENGVKPRKMPPPMPLALNRPPRPIFIEAEPSPLESPEQALKAIDQQLKKLDEPMDEPTSAEDKNRMTLLANLEMEMGMQENHWQRIKQNMNRDSLSTIQSSTTTSPNPASRSELVRISIMSQLDEPSSSEQIRQHLSIPVNQVQSQANLRSRSSSSRSSLGKQPSTESYSRSGSRMSYLAVVPSMIQVGSPTPPDTDESESETEVEAMSEADAEIRLSEVIAPGSAEPALWASRVPENDDAAIVGGNLWVPAAQKPKSLEPLRLTDTAMRSTTRKILEPLRVESTSLWMASVNQAKAIASDTGMWKAPVPLERVESPIRKTPARPLTQRPPRRAKRITMLPDILESPKPLPNKRDTLGIFQFPWGEKSDVPTVQLRPQTFMAIPGTMSSARSTMAPSNVLSPNSLEPQGYSSSFLDEYENEDDFESLSEYGEDSNSGDDDFDESTLWEIASLLQSNKVPSQSNLPREDEQSSQEAAERVNSPILDDFLTEDIANPTTNGTALSGGSTLQTPRAISDQSLRHDSTVLGEHDFYDDILTEEDMAEYKVEAPAAANARPASSHTITQLAVIEGQREETQEEELEEEDDVEEEIMGGIEVPEAAVPHPTASPFVSQLEFKDLEEQVEGPQEVENTVADLDALVAANTRPASLRSIPEIEAGKYHTASPEQDEDSVENAEILITASLHPIPLPLSAQTGAIEGQKEESDEEGSEYGVETPYVPPTRPFSSHSLQQTATIQGQEEYLDEPVFEYDIETPVSATARPRSSHSLYQVETVEGQREQSDNGNEEVVLHDVETSMTPAAHLSATLPDSSPISSQFEFKEDLREESDEKKELMDEIEIFISENSRPISIQSLRRSESEELEVLEEGAVLDIENASHLTELALRPTSLVLTEIDSNEGDQADLDSPESIPTRLAGLAVVVPNSMWSSRSQELQVGFGLPQATKWQSYITSSSEKTARAKLRKASPSAVSSSELWMPSFHIKQVTTRQFLWSNPKQDLEAQSIFQSGLKPAISAVPERLETVKELKAPEVASITPKSIDVEATAPTAPASNATKKNAFEWKSMPKIGSWSPWGAKKEAAPQTPPQTTPEAPIESSSSEAVTAAPKAQRWLFASRARSNSEKKADSPLVETKTVAPDQQEPRPWEQEGKRNRSVTRIQPWRTTDSQKWDAALQKAIRAGKRISIPAASEADWDVALVNAILAGSRLEKAAPIVAPEDAAVERLVEEVTFPEPVGVPVTNKNSGGGLNLWSRPSPTPSSVPNTPGSLWQPIQRQDSAEDTIAELGPTEHIKTSRSARSEKVRSLYSTSFEFSSQALWNPTRAITHQQRDRDQKDWLREESAFGWYQ